jgi:hypothetical protein
VPYQCDPSGSDWLRQGEILEGLLELRPVPTQGSTKDDLDVVIETAPHPLVVVVSQDCDLEWDYKARHGLVGSHKLLSHILFCDLYEHGQVRTREDVKSDIMKRIRQNQDERHHSFPGVSAENGDVTLSPLIMDFKSYFSMPTGMVYMQLERNWVVRKGILPVPHRYAASHRLMGFLGRVALPAEEQEA